MTPDRILLHTNCYFNAHHCSECNRKIFNGEWYVQRRVVGSPNWNLCSECVHNGKANDLIATFCEVTPERDNDGWITVEGPYPYAHLPKVRLGGVRPYSDPLMFTDGERVYYGHFEFDPWNCIELWPIWVDNTNNETVASVTHWMPLPKLPVVVEKPIDRTVVIEAFKRLDYDDVELANFYDSQIPQELSNLVIACGFSSMKDLLDA